MKPEHEIVLSGPAADIRRESARRTRRSFLTGGVSAAAAAAAAYYVDHTPAVGRLQSALRRTEDANAAVTRAVFGERGLAPTYPLARAVPLRLNGTIGLEKALDLSSYRLQIAGADAGTSPFHTPDLTAWQYTYTGEGAAQPPGTDSKSANALNPTGASDSQAARDIAARFEKLATSTSRKRNIGDAEAGPSASSLDRGTPGYLLRLEFLTSHFPQVDLVTEFKCVEGWSSITHWTGIRLRDLLDAFPPQRLKDDNDVRHQPAYLYMETPEGNYYAGFDLAAARHPQSLLVTHMHGQPLAQEHGAPLRLHMPIKYGYKQLKRIGLIAYSFSKPDDYWTRLGYDWYAGL